MGATIENGSCTVCGYLWSMPVDDAIRVVEEAPARYAQLLAHGASSRSDDPDVWSATGYLWHVVDVIRYGTERLWTLTLDSGATVPGWDQEAMAESRRYEKLSTSVGLRALQVAVLDWIEAASEAPLSGHVEHPTLGTLTTIDSIRRNAHEVVHHAIDVERWVKAK